MHPLRPNREHWLAEPTAIFLKREKAEQFPTKPLKILVVLATSNEPVSIRIRRLTV